MMRYMLAARPLKRQWEAMAGHLPFQDMAFAATYGPLLAAKRAQFLETAHPAWDIVGKWLRTMVDKDIGWLHTLKGLLESGIFFSSDLMEQVMVAKLSEASSWAHSSDVTRDWRKLCIIEGEPSTLWLLKVRPYLARFQNILMKLWTLQRDLNENQESRDYESPGAAYPLIALVEYMTRDEQDAYAFSLCLMIDKLDIIDDWRGDTNMALEVFGKINRLPRECAELVLRYTFNQEDITHERLCKGIEVLQYALSSDRLHELLAPMPEVRFQEVFMYEADDPFRLEFITCGHLLDLLVKARRRLSEATLRIMAENIGGWLSYHDYDDRMRGSQDPFRQLCEMSVEPHMVTELMERAFVDSDDE